jgi:hypothetical protein
MLNVEYSGSGDPSNRFVVLPSISLPPDVGEVDYFYIAYHHGLFDTINNTAIANFPFPLASAGIYDLHGNIIATRPLVFEFPTVAGDIGLYADLWQYFLSLIRQKEIITQSIKLSIADILNLKSMDSILINNNEYFVKNPKVNLPVQPTTSLELIRL